MAPFYGRGSTASSLEPLGGSSLPFTTKSTEIAGTHFMDLRRMKGGVSPGVPSGFEHGTPGLEIQHLNC